MFKIREIKEGYIEKPSKNSTNEDILQYFNYHYKEKTQYSPLNESGEKRSERRNRWKVELDYRKISYMYEGQIMNIEAGIGYIYANGNWAEIIK